MTNTEFLIEKVLSFLIVGTLIFSLSIQAIVTLFIVLGQAHFLIAYIYKYSSGNMSKSLLILYPIALIPLLFLAFTGQLILLALLSTVFFAIHFAQDEMFLSGKATSIFTSLEVLAFVLVVSGIMFDLLLQTSFVMYFFAVAALVLAVYGYLLFKKKYIFTRSSIYLLTLIFLLSIAMLMGYQFQLEKLIGAIILLHYSAWYINYFFKTKNNPSYRKQYINRVMFSNVVAIGLFFFLLSTEVILFNYIFALIYFYVWTIMHILVSVRVDDYTNGIKIA